jgi:hypothetical protein
VADGLIEIIEALGYALTREKCDHTVVSALVLSRLSDKAAERP